MEYIYACTRVTDIRNKTVDQLKKLKEMGLRAISLCAGSGDDWTLDLVNKGYHAVDIIEQCGKLSEAGIDFWLNFLNGVAGKEHSMDHAIHSAEIFSRCKPMLVGTGGLVLFPGTPLLEEAEHGEFQPLSEQEMFIELKRLFSPCGLNCGLCPMQIRGEYSGCFNGSTFKNFLSALLLHSGNRTVRMIVLLLDTIKKERRT